MKMYRQGDVLIIEAFREVSQPRGIDVHPQLLASLRATGTADAPVVLVHGELTGHAHRAVGDVTVFDTGQGMMVDAPKGFRLTHDEHDTIEIPEGFYLVRRQREYDENEVMRYVQD